MNFEIVIGGRKSLISWKLIHFLKMIHLIWKIQYS